MRDSPDNGFLVARRTVTFSAFGVTIVRIIHSDDPEQDRIVLFEEITCH